MQIMCGQWDKFGDNWTNSENRSFQNNSHPSRFFSVIFHTCDKIVPFMSLVAISVSITHYEIRLNDFLSFFFERFYFLAFLGGEYPT